MITRTEKTSHVKIEIATVCIVAFIALFIRVQSPKISDYFNFDEADYIVAMKYGFFSNYFGLDEEAGWKYVMQCIRGTKNKIEVHPWHDAMLKNDAAALRHMHPPFGYYFTAIIADMGIEDETLLRFGVLIYGIMTVVCVYFLTRQILKNEAPFIRIIYTTAAALFTALSKYHIIQSVELGGHAAFSFFAVLFLLFSVISIQRKSMKWWYTSCASLAAGFLSIEYSLLLIPSFFFSASYLIHSLQLSVKNSSKMLLNGAVIFIGSVFVLWPPYIYEMAWLKQWITYGNIVIHPLAANTAFERYWLFETMITHPGFFIGMAAVIGVVIFTFKSGIRKDSRILWSLLPLLMYVLCFLLINLRVNHIRPLYAAHIIPVSGSIFAVVLFIISEKIYKPLKFLPVVLFFGTFPFMLRNMETGRKDSHWRQDFITANKTLQGKTFYALNNVPVLKLYLPNVTIIDPPVTKKEHSELTAFIDEGQLNGFLRISDKQLNTKYFATNNWKCSHPKTLPLGKHHLQVWKCKNFTPFNCRSNKYEN